MGKWSTRFVKGGAWLVLPALACVVIATIITVMVHALIVDDEDA